MVAQVQFMRDGHQFGHAARRAGASDKRRQAERGRFDVTDRDGGHGQGKPLSLRVRDAVDRWSFIMWQTGCCR